MGYKPFLPPDRMRQDLLLLWREILPRYRDLRLLFLLDTPWAILSETRQLIIASPSFCEATACPMETVVGKRPGEVLYCIHSTGPGGCGTGQACSECGAAQTIAQALQGHTARSSTAFLRRTANGRLQATNASVTAAFFRVGFTPFILFSFQPSNDTTELQYMERLFFHDLLNGMNALVGALTLVHEKEHSDLQDLLGMTLERAWAMVREIRTYKALNAAERGALTINLEPTDIAALCRQLVAIHRTHPLAAGKKLDAVVPWTLPITSDPQLITRIVENLLKNALEASSPGDQITLRLEVQDTWAVLTVHNPAWMPPAVQARVFQRGHSTKGTGRGFGTYSVRLLGKNYLAGKVSFVSTPEGGTTFMVYLPLRHPLDPEKQEHTQQDAAL
jgi:signal transduction histidine kinase